MPLHIAALEDHLSVAAVLLEHGADINAKNKASEIWQLAGAVGSSFLLVYRSPPPHAAISTSAMQDGKTAYKLAKVNGKTAVAAFLKNHGAKTGFFS